MQASQKKTNTYTETLNLFHEHKDEKNLLKIIAEKRELKPLTIENHLISLYEQGHISLADMLKCGNLEDLKSVKCIIENELHGNTEKLKPIKEKLEEK